MGKKTLSVAVGSALLAFAVFAGPAAADQTLINPANGDTVKAAPMETISFSIAEPQATLGRPEDGYYWTLVLGEAKPTPGNEQPANGKLETVITGEAVLVSGETAEREHLFSFFMCQAGTQTATLTLKNAAGDVRETRVLKFDVAK